MRHSRPWLALATPVAVLALVLSGTVLATAAVVGHQVPNLDTGIDRLPPLAQAAAHPASAPSTVVAADGSPIGQFVPSERFAPLAPDQIPPLVTQVVTASEDPTFFEHHGFTPAAMIRAALTNASAGHAVEGGSTITQQLAKNLYTDGARTLGRKVRELAIAVHLEDRYSKKELLAAYLNSTYFGEGAVGIRAAANVYFATPVEQLGVGEVALLVGLIPAPSDRDPRVHPAEAEAARQEVLDRVQDSRQIEQSAIDAARAAAPALAPPVMTTSTDPYFMEYVRQWLLGPGHLTPDQVMSGGLRIETTLDRGVQDAAAAAIAAHLPDPQGPTAATVVLDHHNGHVIALIGGRDWSASKVDLARGVEGGGAGRQPGSSFKPFVLAAALVAGFRPDDPVPAPASMAVDGADHPVENYAGAAYGTLNVTEATVHSVNTSYTWLTEQVGPQAVRDMATSLGIGHLPPTGVGPSIGLGAYETSPLDMVAAYSAIAEDGHRVDPTPVARVIGPDGKVIIDRTAPPPGPGVLDPAFCRTVTDILTQVVQRGTGTAARLDRPVAGKTGTTDDYTNAWFVGYTPELAASVWVGYANANTPMHDVSGVADVTGGSIPAAIWHDVMAAATASIPVAAFPPLLPLPPSPRSPAPAPDPAATPPPPAGGGAGGGGGGGADKHHKH